MTICKQYGNRYLFSYLVIAVIIAFFTTALDAGELSESAPRAFNFEVRLASLEKVEGWKSVPGVERGRTIWISPEVTLTNADVAQAQPQIDDGISRVLLLLTEKGALKFARLTKAHIGEPVATLVNGRVVSVVPKIMDEITGGRVDIAGAFTAEEARLIAEGILRGYILSN